MNETSENTIFIVVNKIVKNTNEMFNKHFIDFLIINGTNYTLN